ncbi:trans-hexaprenyltranstransferase [Coprinopsis cinerea okayama7|uniref:Trans-hexaprenyltranstransferase n=1 Tax=Coprinopsis cinerea (strain Okayama-7 / 130 / ATCC MYA-4618 / FGSC 9003) TaxID=240176 RepID=A8N368_COPC7|nr:trans-hexaprenyltranstransferase [Coprinopsis cinerea okayama7\|eukprot:XP_001829313.2 trans-hexaprenyltranstransferase [Coprinopsis cinerea okayama7\
MQGLGRSLRVSASTRISRSSIPCTSGGSAVTRHKRRKVSVLAQKTATTEPAAWTRPKQDPLAFPTEPSPSSKTQQRLRPDPFRLVSPELNVLRSNLLGLLGSAHPGLAEIAEYYFLHPSKQLRSLLVLLFARATNGLGRDWQLRHWEAGTEAHGGRAEELDRPLRSSETLSDCNPNMPDHTASFAKPFELRRPSAVKATSIPPFPHPPPLPTLITPPMLLPTQMRLAQIVEMIHVALLLHQNISDASKSPSSDSQNPFGNKLSILGGDFLLGRASTVLSHLGGGEVVELIASVISNLVEGEFLGMDKVQTPGLGVMEGPRTREEAWDLYLRKTYLKSASLMAKGARASVVLGGCGENEVWKEVAYAYGRSLGIAYQLIEDTLDYDACSPGLQPGLATAPVLYALEEHPELKHLIARNLTGTGDIEAAIQCVQQSSGVERTRLLAHAYAEKARETLQRLPDSDTKLALEGLTETVITRTW